MEREKILSVEALSKNFGKLRAVSDVDFHVGKGEFFGIIGPNGAGKTTLFNMITGFLPSSGGEVFFRGQAIAQKRPYQIVSLGLARTFQIPRPFWELTVRENIEISNPSKYGIRKKIDIDDIMEEVGLWKSKKQLVSNLPQGDLRRLEVARTLATNPEVLMLDEPYAGLGPREMSSLTDLLLRLNDKGLTIIIIEHKLKELMKFMHRVLVLNFGQKIADDKPDNLRDNETVIKAYLGKGNW